jgi:NAD(P)H-hydrate repair Nnr-like enzyme with NAD(P)H-hydrate epimerase domain
MILQVDGKQYEVDITRQSERLAKATQRQRENFEVAPAGYGIHWPDVDEDLSIDGLIGVKHACPLAETTL